LLNVVAGAVASSMGLGETPADASQDGGRPVDWGRFLAVLGLVMCALFAVVLLVSAIPLWVIDPCQG
jgi:hypothetical protein